MPVNDELRDGAIRHSVYLTRYSTGVVNKIMRLLAKTDRDIIRRLQSKNLPGSRTPYQRERLERLIKGVREISIAGSASMAGLLRDELRDLNAYEVNFLANQINAALVVDLQAVTPALGTVYSAALSTPFQGKYLRQWTAQLSANKAREIADSIRISVVEGETISDTIRRLRGTRNVGYKNGVLFKHRRHAEAIARTAVNHIVTHARRDVFRANADIVKAYQYVATLDGRTTDICMSLDGKTWPTREEAPTPPQHINCRSSIAPVVKSWKELGFKRNELDAGQRASMNGAVSAKETYGTWLRKQPASFQNDVLGRTKAKLFREGGVSLDRFVDPTGRSYTLAELRRIEARAFDRIGD